MPATATPPSSSRRRLPGSRAAISPRSGGGVLNDRTRAEDKGRGNEPSQTQENRGFRGASGLDRRTAPRQVKLQDVQSRVAMVFGAKQAPRGPEQTPKNASSRTAREGPAG